MFFVLCSLVPLLAIGYLTLGIAAGQLEEQAVKRLRHISKATGMVLMERLLMLETELRSSGLDLLRRRDSSRESEGDLIDNTHEGYFTAYYLMDEAGQPLDRSRSTRAFSDLSLRERRHLNDGKPLIHIEWMGDKSTLYLATRLIRPGHEPIIVFAIINPAYLWRIGAALSVNNGFFVLDHERKLLYSSFPGGPPLSELQEELSRRKIPEKFSFTRDGEHYLASHWSLFTRPTFSMKYLTIVQAQTSASILGPLHKFKKLFPRTLLLSFVLAIFLSLIQIRRTLMPIEQLKAAIRQLSERDFSTKVDITSNDEFQELGRSFNSMAAELKDHFDNMETINRIGINLSLKQKRNEFLGEIVAGAMKVIKADAGFVYLLTDDRILEPSTTIIESKGLNGNQCPHSAIVLGDETSPGMVAGHTAMTGVSVNLSEVYESTDRDITLNKRRDEELGYQTHSILSVAMTNHEDDIIGVMELVNARNDKMEGQGSFNDEDQRLLESLASQAAVAFSKNQLIQDLQSLFEALIELIVTAIDEKSPYTGDHCKRVPIITMMLAKAACDAKEGNLKDFSLTEEEMTELKVAALLHDCGKVTTPVHVVDKGTKLETLVDRIHLVNTRFELLKRDAEITALQSGQHLNDVPNRAESVKPGKGLQHRLQQIDEDREFLNRCNIGTEFMDPDDLERVHSIARRYTWSGPGGNEGPCLTEDEIHNLTIEKGTLTPEERIIIQHHVVTTIKLLENLPYPKYLRRVPEFAGAHHERVDGKGYPKGLKGDELAMQSRIIAIADIFEALTAKDRPYKDGMTLSDSLTILKAMKEEGSIDGDLVDLFLKEKVYLRYAEEYLDPEQIDEEFIGEFGAFFTE